MEPNGRPHHSGRDTYMAVLLCVLVGVPLFAFFNVLTGGLFILLLAMAACVAVLAAFNYFLWGRSFNKQVSGEREEQELRERMRPEAWPYGEPFEHRRN
jgi:hypothetical protein